MKPILEETSEVKWSTEHARVTLAAVTLFYFKIAGTMFARASVPEAWIVSVYTVFFNYCHFMRLNGSHFTYMNEWMNERMNECMNEWMNEWMNE